MKLTKRTCVLKKNKLFFSEMLRTFVPLVVSGELFFFTILSRGNEIAFTVKNDDLLKNTDLQ